MPDELKDNPAASQKHGLPLHFIGSSGEGECQIAVPAELSVNNSLEEIFLFARQQDASDVHLSTGCPLTIRRYQQLIPISKDTLSPERMNSILQSAFDKELLSEFLSTGGVEFVHTISGGGRYRVTIMKSRAGIDLTARIIPLKVRSFKESGMPESCAGLTKWAQGLVLIAGPAGCGKTATMSTLVDMINQTRHDHIITIENPIEVVYKEDKCQITQREINMHTESQANALRAALRQDPDIIVISELRDLETIQLAVTAAETGHLVLGTMNTITAAQTISSVIDSFPPDEQDVITMMISESLRGIICHQMIAKKDGSGVVHAHEVLMVNRAVANMIREKKFQNIENTIATGRSEGMVALDASLEKLVSQGLISGEEAFARATMPRNFQRYL